MSSTFVPQRMCAACRKKRNKSDLWRIELHPGGAVFDPSGRGTGRGLYVCRDESCLHLLYRKRLRLPGSVLAQVRTICAQLLPEE